MQACRYKYTWFQEVIICLSSLNPQHINLTGQLALSSWDCNIVYFNLINSLHAYSYTHYIFISSFKYKSMGSLSMEENNLVVYGTEQLYDSILCID